MTRKRAESTRAASRSVSFGQSLFLDRAPRSGSEAGGCAPVGSVSHRETQGGDLCRQFPKLAMHLGQPRDHLKEPALLADGNRRRAEDVLTVWNVAVNAGLGTDDHAVADVCVVLDTCLAGHDDVIAGLAASGDADLAAQQVVWADLVIVADHNQVIDLGPFADPRGLEGCTVDRAIRADFDVVVDLEPASMWNLDMAAFDMAIAETIAAENTSGVHLDPIAENHISIKHRVGMNDTVAAKLATISDDSARVQRGSITDRRAVADIREWIDRHVLADPTGRGDARLRVDAGPAWGGIAVQMCADGQKGRHRIVHFDDSQARARFLPGELKCGPTIAAEAGEVFRSLANRSLSMNVISPGPASATVRAERIETEPSPTRRPRTSAANCSTVATTAFSFLP